ncbi:MAG TPA: glycosyltransferase 87 family protein [Pseudonocardiaceae bacterium]|nr:glycosyltransferase 87 family protein [Pseudonocardiaceae bacterium]
MSVRWLAAVALLAVAGIATVYQCFHTFIDLDVYRLGVRQWWDGGDMYGTLPPTHDGVRLPFIYPPFAAIALLPLAVIPWSLARVANFGLMIAGLAVTIYLSLRRLWPALDRPHAVLISGAALPLALWLEPVRETIRFGQVNLFLMTLVAADCLAGKPRWPRGLLVGVAAAIKLTPAVFVLYFLLRRDVRAALVAGATGALATAVGFVVLPGESVRYWFGGFAGAGGLSGSPYASNQSLRAALARLGLSPPIQSGLWLLAAIVVLAAAGAGVTRASRAGDPVLAITITGAAGLLLSPVSWSHHWVWIVPALLAMAARAVRTQSPGWIAATVITAATFSIGAHNFLPRGDSRELGWRAGQHLIGDSYALLTLVLLIAWVVPVVINRSVPARSASRR